MKIILLGTGAAIHALSWKIVSEPQVVQVHCSPGNAGTMLLLGPPPFSSTHGAEIAQWAFSQQADLVVVQARPTWVEILSGVELAVLGVDERREGALNSRENVRNLLQSRGVPIREGRTFWNLEAAERYVASQRLPLWFRPDHSSQKEVVRVEERLTAFQELARLLSLDATAGVCVEEDIVGEEIALALLCDGNQAIPFGISRPYSRRYEGETGPMTAGMGAYAPYGDATLEGRLMVEVGQPVVAALAAADLLRPAFLHLRIVLSSRGPLLNSLSWDLDDLHAAVTLPRWGGNLIKALEDAVHGRLAETTPQWKPGVAVAIAIVMEGYPGPVPQGQPIQGLFDVQGLVFHQSTRLQRSDLPTGPLPWLRSEGPARSTEMPGPVLSAGGRVLLAVGQAPTGREARRRAYERVAHLSFPMSSWRRDIAAELE